MVDEKWRRLQASSSTSRALVALENLWIANWELGPRDNEVSEAVRREVDTQMIIIRATVLQQFGQARLDQFDGEMARRFPGFPQ